MEGFSSSLKALLDGSSFTKKLAKSINYLHVSIMKPVAYPLGVFPIFSDSLSTFYVSNRIGKLFTWERCFFMSARGVRWFSIEEWNCYERVTFRGCFHPNLSWSSVFLVDPSNKAFRRVVKHKISSNQGILRWDHHRCDRHIFLTQKCQNSKRR